MNAKVSLKKELITLIACILITFLLDTSINIGYEKETLKLFPSWVLDIMLGAVIYNFWFIFRLVFFSKDTVILTKKEV